MSVCIRGLYFKVCRLHWSSSFQMAQLKWKFWSWEACHVLFDVFWVSAYNLNTAAVKTDAHCCCNVDSSAWRKKTRQSQRTEFRVSASYAMKFRNGEIEHCFYKNFRILNCNGIFGVKSNGNKIWWVVNGIDLSWKDDWLFVNCKVG